jgi:hypothetical protein
MFDRPVLAGRCRSPIFQCSPTNRCWDRVMESIRTGNDTRRFMDRSLRCWTRSMPKLAVSRLTAPVMAHRPAAIVAARAGNIAVIIAPHVTAVPSATADHHPSRRAGPAHCRDGGERAAGLAEGNRLRPAFACRDTMGRYKAIIGPRPHARSLPGQCAETSLGMDVLNLYAGRPDSVRNPSVAANVKLAGKTRKTCSGFTGYEYVRSPASFTLER